MNASTATLWLTLVAPSQPPDNAAPPLDDAAVLRRVTVAVDNGLQHLAKVQYPDGSWPSGYGGGGRNHGVSAVALLAFLGRGHHPERGRYRETITKAANHMISTQRRDGLYASPNQSHGPMYEHALATLALVEMFGMTQDAKLEPSLRKAVALTLRSQSAEGGWRYQPNPYDADISVTVMFVVALRAAQNAGMSVPQATLDKAIAYVRKCATKNGGYGYQPNNNEGPARTAAGILSMQLAGQPNDPSVRPALDYLNKQPIVWGGEYFYYTHYYAIQAQYQAGGDSWNRWHPQIRELLLKHQQPNGSWQIPPGGNEHQTADKNNVFPTAMACLVLEVYFHLLPAYQR